MNREDIIRMAREAGWTGPEDNLVYVAMLERFAELVRAALRQALANEALDRMAENARELGLDYDAPVVTSDTSQERVDETAKQRHDFECPRCGHCCQQREWVGLTKAERDEIWENSNSQVEAIKLTEAMCMKKQSVPVANDNWQQYAKDGETAQQVIERTRADLDAFLKLYVDKGKNACITKLKGDNMTEIKTEIKQNADGSYTITDAHSTADVVRWLLTQDTRETILYLLDAPQRQWVGLTKEEAKEITMANRPYVVDVIKALEARLKEKNT
jgi:hypothetical protein